MAKRRRAYGGRDGGAFVALPHVVLKSPGWLQAGHTARSLLIDMACQYNGKNNGRLVATLDLMEAYGWRSPAVLVQARKELIACGLLIEVRKGGFPNRAAWHALSWLDLDQTDGLDVNWRAYDTVHRGAYMRPQTYARPKRRKAAELDTPRVAGQPSTDTGHVPGAEIAAMPDVAMS